MEIDKDLFFVVKNFLDKSKCDSIRNKMEDYIDVWSHQGLKEASRDNISDLYNLPFLKKDSQNILNRLSDILQKELLFTYSFGMKYYPGGFLPPHVDRPQSQYGININIWKSDHDFPIIVTDPKTEKQTRIDLDIGDALIYKGSELVHERKKITEGNIIQFMVFAVEKGSDYEIFADENYAEDEWKELDLPLVKYIIDTNNRYR